MSTAASRAWLGVAVIGFVVVALVLATSLIPRLSAGEKLADATEPAFTDERMAATRAGVGLLSQYVDLVDPLLTARGRGSRESRSVVRLIRRELGLSSAQARRILRREAPHVEALMRALPLERVAGEIPAFAAYLATTLTISADELAAMLEQRFPRIAQLLSTLPNVSDAWYDVPGIEGLTRLSRGKPVRTVPGLRKYLRDDLVPLAVEHKDDVQDLSVAGGIGYIPYLLLFVGLALLLYGLAQARRGATTAPGIIPWSVVVGVGVLLLMVTVVGQYSPRLSGAQRVATELSPLFDADRVKGLSTGYDTVHEAVLVGDSIMTRRGGVAGETGRLYRLVGERTGRSAGDVRRALMRTAPHTIALLDALPLTRVAREARQLVAYLTRALKLPRARVVSRLRRTAPRLTRALLAAPAVTAAWTELPERGQTTRFDGVTPVRTLPAFDDYLRLDLIPVLVRRRESFDRFATGFLKLDTVAPALLVLCVVILLYGGLMMQIVGRR